MPTVIDSLVIELGLDPTKFTREQKEILENFRRSKEEFRRGGIDIERQGARIEDAFTSLKRGAIQLGATFLGISGAKSFLDHITSADAMVGRFAKTMNLTTAELSIWQGAAKQVGGSAEDVTSTMQGLTGAVNQFMLTGQGPFLGVMTHLGVSLFDSNNRLKTTTDLLLEVSDAVHKLNTSDPARAAATLAMIPGMNQTSINMMINGRQALLGLLEASRASGYATKESAAAAAEYQKNLAELQQSAEDLGRTLVNALSGSLVRSFQVLKSLIDEIRSGGWKGALRVLAEAADPRMAEMIYGSNVAGADAIARQKLASGMRAQQENARPAPTSPGGRRMTLAEQEAYIRKAAVARGIDPEIAVEVARREGMNTSVVGDNQQSAVVKNGVREPSYGPFQLYMGGGLGNKFLKEKGLDPRDPTTVKEQIDFALDEARKSGWGAWYGWKGLPRAGLPPPSQGAATGRMAPLGRTGDAGGTSTSVTIGEINVNTQATDANGIANELPAAIKRANFAASANYGQT